MKIIRKVAFVYLMAMMVGVFASVQGPTIPPGFCSEECELEFDPNETDGGIDYQNCIADCENGGLPIDNSLLYLFLAGTLLASFVLLKKPKHKKTPM